MTQTNAYRPSSSDTVKATIPPRPSSSTVMMNRFLPTVTWRLAESVYDSAFQFEVAGRELIPRKGSCVFVANHTSHLDLLALISQLPGERRANAVPLAAADYFFRNRVCSSLSSGILNAVPFRRDAGHRHELGDLRRELIKEGNNWSCVMFPEGTRSRNGNLGEFRAGIGCLVAGTRVPVVPCHISGAFDAWPKGQTLPRPGGQLTVHFGAPLQFERVENRRSGWNHVAEQLKASVKHLA